MDRLRVIGCAEVDRLGEGSLEPTDPDRFLLDDVPDLDSHAFGGDLEEEVDSAA